MLIFRDLKEKAVLAEAARVKALIMRGIFGSTQIIKPLFETQWTWRGWDCKGAWKHGEDFGSFFEQGAIGGFWGKRYQNLTYILKEAPLTTVVKIIWKS